MVVSRPGIIVRDYTPGDAGALTDIFYNAVHRVAIGFYSAAQVNVWAPLPPEYAMWQSRFSAKPPLVAVLGERVVGFMTLEPNGHMDWTYTHHAYQLRGVASCLFAHLQQKAAA